MTDEQLLVDTSDLVHIDNTETINGLKYFSHDTVVANASQMITNCITEIPQDAHYTLNNGILTIKAGTKTYIPNGFETDGITRKFIEYIVESDVDYPINHVNGALRIVAVSSSNVIYGYLVDYWFSGDVAPVVTGSCGWYDTANNVIKISSSDGSSWSTPNVSLPILGGAYTNNYGFTSITTVFNGLGYIGSTVFALPGIKGLIPNGRNADGTLKNISYSSNSVKVRTVGGDETKTLCLGNGIGLVGNYKYNESENMQYSGETAFADGLNCGQYTTSNGKITSLIPRTVFHALDYSDKSTISGWGMPSSRHVNLTLLASGSTYTAPANGWLEIRKSGSDQEYIKFTGLIETCASASGSNVISLFVPMKKSDTVTLTYTASGTTHVFRFVYAEGEK